MKTQTPARLSLPAVAARLQMSWSQAFNAVLSGKLRGKQQPNGRWLVDAASVMEYERQRAAQTTGGVAA